jgi:biopolymer transport protein ExbB
MIEAPLLSIIANTSPEGSRAAWDFLLRGGIFMIPLALASVAGLMAIVYKALSLSPQRVIPPQLERDVAEFQQRIGADKVEPILQQFREGGSTLARLGAVAVKHRGRSQNEIIQAVEASARQETVHLHAGIGVLDTVITVAPLLGLLGTASGLVVIFQGLGETTDHLAIARGIAEALNTTIAGLAIAVPCVIAHSYFTRRIETLTARLESLLAELASACKKPGSSV